MKISQLSAKPKLIKLTIDSEDIVTEFGEAVEFYTWDRQPLDVFMKLASANTENYSAMVDILRTMILDEEGRQVIQGENMLPSKVLVAAMTKITEVLGN